MQYQDTTKDLDRESKNREIKTVMHPIKVRTLTVKRTERIAPHIQRITLSGSELSDFVSLSADDHVKVFFPYPGETTPVLPTMGEQGMETQDGRPPLMRDYTPRRFDLKNNELDLEFVLHGTGPGSLWAEHAVVGDSLTVAGPRGSRIVPYSFDWYLMIGDETSIPSVARRLEELPAGAKAVVVLEVENESCEVSFSGNTNTEIHWVYRRGRPPGELESLKKTVMKLQLPLGDYFAWVSAEKSCAMALKELLLNVKGAQEEWIKATGYWMHKKELPS